jgi:hypothetical protein
MDKTIDFTYITACGACCVGCREKANGLCQGCIESDGNCKEWTQSGYLTFISVRRNIMCNSAVYVMNSLVIC